jgi:hypothetical protein
MEIFVIVAIAFLIYFFFIAPKIGNINFWKFAAKNPEESWKFFNEHPDWFIGSPPNSPNYCGPYKALNPYTQTFVNIYCTSLEIAQKTQNEFIKKFN